ncbi:MULTISPECIES: phosphoglycolate phosphatase [unclassified Methylophilus]|uniref:phosphoglycolate phosphatase n=1 Tax=unclassified Methylophilus TaxID=2630143 RepID=UPI0023B2C04F|nr:MULTISPECIES: phosphoglycolate phosphatase [unclassified Methylophilus]MDF0379093.1 phosphoglycolate phosphatase [Methylophilus sp. YYY-1]MDT7848656.1 phosphoglycolate phosphatase [Methylophilus sp. VKM B-3414]
MRFQVKLVMFDLDGTLLDTAPQIAEAANRMLVALGKPMLPQAQIATYIGEGVQNLIKRCLTESVQVEPEADLFAQAQPLYHDFYTANATQSQPFAGVVPALQQLKKQGFRLACVTNKPEKFTLPLLQQAGLADFFEVIISGDSLPKKKPDPLPLLHICQKLGVLPAEAVLVGDSETDIQAAHAAGCFVVTVPYGYNQGREIDVATVDATVQQLTEVVNLLELPALLKQGS